jgi:hypothetical protein
MSNKSRRNKKKKRRQPSSRQSPWLWLAGGGALLFVVSALLLARPWSGGGSSSTLDEEGSPRLVVDQTIIDEGYIKYDVPISTAFRLSNAGDGPLKILETPQVRLVDGC